MKYFVSGFCIFLSLLVKAEFRVPDLTGPVVDLVHIITPKDREYIERQIREVQDQGLAQLQVLTVPELEGLSIEEASIKVVDNWKLGDQKTDKGLLVLVANKERRIRIEVGQGLEGIIPDVVARRIVSDTIVPFFKQGVPSQGLVQGIDKIIEVIRNQSDPVVAKPRQSIYKKYEGLFFLIFLLLLSGLNLFGRRFRGRYYGGGFGGFGGGGGWSGGGGGWSGGGGGFSGGGSSDGW